MKQFMKEYFKLLGFAKSHRGLLCLAAVCMGVSTIFEGISMGMIVPLCDRIFTDKVIIIPGNLPKFLASIIGVFNTTESAVLLSYTIFFVPVLFFFKGLFMYLQNLLMNMVGQGVVRQVRDKLYSKFHELSLDFYADKRSGELMSRITNDVAFITHSLSYALTDLIYESMRAIVFAVIAFFLAFSISWRLPLFAFVIFPLIMFPVLRIGKRVKKFSIVIQKRMADLNSQLSETIQGAYIVKAFCRENYELERFKRINHQYYKFMMKNIKRMIILSPLTEFIGVTSAMAIVWIVGKEVLAGRLSFGVFGLFLGALLSIIRPIKKLSNVHVINQQALAASSRIYDILEEKSTIMQKSDAKEISDLNDAIVFDNVTFAYENEEVLKNINLNVKKGEVIALVGHSGAGKSTLVGLLPRLYDPKKGKITIDGVDLRDLKIKPLRMLISVVSQEMVLFNATVKDNIAYGRVDATLDEIKEAARKAYAFEFIENLPNGFSTVIGDRGFKLSGGERQRIAIARAILKDSPVLILDEATSHLDSKSEQLIKEALSNLMRGKTSFVIAHRLSTVQKANRIAVLDKGQIVEIGPHDDLLVQDAFYKKLYDLQFSA
ncbi:MAG: ABC transporter ATP-binding protein [Candidatus Omnitrophica bacterium]|nr:ABC transporter ATP-binding protein [Candidatus Omnitrophota bacterium]